MSDSWHLRLYVLMGIRDFMGHLHLSSIKKYKDFLNKEKSCSVFFYGPNVVYLGDAPLSFLDGASYECEVDQVDGQFRAGSNLADASVKDQLCTRCWCPSCTRCLPPLALLPDLRHALGSSHVVCMHVKGYHVFLEMSPLL